ncbi:MAG: glycosyltransferase [Clostridiales bacterium]|nr:glycosyltransferase [Clostridiales bacterium]
MTPKLSVIIPVYNAARYLRQTLDSVLNQSLRDIEVICVDDGSTDESPAFLQEYAKKDSRVQLLRQENLHAGVARNAGMAVAKGEYLHFLDADDYVLDYAYEAIYNKAVKYDLDCLKFASVAYDEARQATVELPSFTLDRLRPGDFHRLLTLDEDSPIYKVNVAPWNGIYRRSFLEEKGLQFNDLFCVNDRSFFCAVITNAGHMMLSRDRLVVHRVSLTDSLIGVRAEHFDCHFRSIERISRQLTQDQVDENTTLILMRKEFNDLLTWCQRYCDGSELGEQIAADTEAFVASYDGLYATLLQELYVEFHHKLAKEQLAEEEPAKELNLFREACENPKVSVVLPIYNVEDYLNEALYSLSVQTLNEMEFICVNDGSTDGSMTIIKEYANVDKRFRILDGPNGGYGKAMNRGIDATRGKYLGILEPDDFVPAKMFQVLYRTASKNQLDFVKADFYRFMIKEDGSMKKTLNRLTDDKRYYNRLVNPSEDVQTFKFVMNTWSGIYSLDFLNRWHIRHNETPGVSYQDNGFWFQTFCRATRAWFLDRAFYMNRRDNPNSSMFNRKKLYCVTDEYRHLWNWMSQEPELLEKFTPIFYAKKFTNFIGTYRRLAPEYQLEYLHHICDEFRPALAAGVLDEELLGNTYWKQLHEILADPEAYHEKIKVSVIMPVYNAEQYLRQTLDSLLVRNETEFEIICVDDGSTDSSLDILREYEAKDFRVRVITQPNGGAGAARNNGMQYARGEYLSFLDADDFFEPEMLRLAYDRAHTLGTDITVFHCDQYFEATGEYAPTRYTINDNLLPMEQPFAGTDIPKDIFKAFVGWAWDKVFRADFVRENHLRFQEQRTSNDMLFVFSAIVKAQRISTMNAVLAHHRRDSGSLSATREKSWDCFYHALCALRQQLKDWNLYDRFEQDFVNYSVHFALWNVTTLRGPSYHKLYEKLTTQWADDLGITAHEEDYFYHPGEYRKMQLLLSSTSEEFLFEELDAAKAQSAALQADKSRLQGQVRNLRSERKGLENRVELLRQESRELRADKKELREQNRSLQKEKKTLQKEKNVLQAKNKAIKQSTIWKVGRIVTWLPRKLKRLFAGKR